MMAPLLFLGLLQKSPKGVHTGECRPLAQVPQDEGPIRPPPPPKCRETTSLGPQAEKRCEEPPFREPPAGPPFPPAGREPQPLLGAPSQTSSADPWPSAPTARAGSAPGRSARISAGPRQGKGVVSAHGSALPPSEAGRDTGIERVVFHLSRFREEAAGAAGGLFQGCFTAGPPPPLIRALPSSPALTTGSENPPYPPKSQRDPANPVQAVAGEECPGFLCRRKAE